MNAKKLLIVLGWLYVAAALLVGNIYFISVGSFVPLYFDVIVILVGGIFLRYHAAIRLWLQGLGTRPLLRFALLGYGMVLFEEVVVALGHNLQEGFTVAGYLARVLQFWNFNILAFAGFIFGSYLLLTKFRFSTREFLVFAGFWGLCGEKIHRTLPGNIPGFLIFLPLTFLVYDVIMAPAMLSLPANQAVEEAFRPRMRRYVLGTLTVIALAIPPLLVLAFLRLQYPLAFPPCEFIACF